MNFAELAGGYVGAGLPSFYSVLDGCVLARDVRSRPEPYFVTYGALDMGHDASIGPLNWIRKQRTRLHEEVHGGAFRLGRAAW